MAKPIAVVSALSALISDPLVAVLTGPSALTVQQAAPTLLGFQLAETGNFAGETFNVVVIDSYGKLSATGTAVSGSGSTNITLTGSLSDVDAALATLTDTNSRQSDNLHVVASDSLGNSTTVNVPVTIDSLVPLLAGPSGLTIQQAAPTLLGFQLGEAGNFAGETFTVEVIDSYGKLSATGTAVSGSGSTNITLTGSLSDVDAALATLTDTNSRQSDNLHVVASDSLGNSTTVNVPVTVDSLVPVLTGPSALTVQQAAPTLLGFQLAEAGNFAGETFTVEVIDSNGKLSATGTAVSGSGSTNITLTGSLSDVNAALTTLTDTDSRQPDSLHVAASDSLGNSTTINAPVTIDSLVPVLTGPSALTVEQAAPTLLGFQLSEAGNYAGETFTVSVTDSNGKLSATGTAVSGSGNTKITLTGSLSDVNAALTTLTDTDSRQPDSLHVAASDSLGNSTTIKCSSDDRQPRSGADRAFCTHSTASRADVARFSIGRGGELCG